MDADEIRPLTAEAIAELLEARRQTEETGSGTEKRGDSRWAFAGAVEMWVADTDGTELHKLGVCHNLSVNGVGVRFDEPMEVGTKMSIAIHQPEASFHGAGVVRHCTPRDNGFLIGVEFGFDAA